MLSKQSTQHLFEVAHENLDDQFDPISNHIKGTGVNLFVKLVTLQMDIDKQTAKFMKKIEKLRWQIRNKVLSKEQKHNKEEEIEANKSFERPTAPVSDQIGPQNT